MLLKRIYDDALAQASYLIGCERTGMAIVIDPNRDIGRYVEAAAKEHLRIAVVTETHIHADFVSGARELARRTAATLALSSEGGVDWSYRFAGTDGARLLHDGDLIEIGDVRLEVMHTPGHTPEHIFFLITDIATSGRPLGMLSGDFIFVGDVGRPDLLERAANVRGTMETLARALFHSLRRTSTLPDYLQIWPGHGAGSACGRALGALPSTTLGYERIANWAFQIDDEEQFIEAVLAGQPEPPKYFARMKTVNRDGPEPVSVHALHELDLDALRAAMTAGSAIVDVRSTADFAAGHIAGTLNIPIGSSFTTWAGALLPDDRDIVLLADTPPRIESGRHALTLIGLDRVAGFALANVRHAWEATVAPLERVAQIDAPALALANGKTIVDVRGRAEWDAGHMPNATHLFLGDLVELTKDLPRDAPLALHCQGGTRSAIAASLLQAQGFTNVSNVAGGFRAWERAGLPVITDDNSSPNK